MDVSSNRTTYSKIKKLYGGEIIMSDEIITENTTEEVTFEKAAPVANATGNPGGTGNVGVPTTEHSSGYIGVGGVGQQNDGDATNYNNLGQALNAQIGGAPSPLDISPSGQTGGGILNPEQSRSFIDYVWSINF